MAPRARTGPHAGRGRLIDILFAANGQTYDGVTTEVEGVPDDEELQPRY